MNENLAILIEQRLQALAPLDLTIRDDSHRHAGHAGARDGGKHFIVAIVSNQFLGRSRVARHRMVYDVLGDLMPQRIHALALQTMTADEAASLLTQGK